MWYKGHIENYTDKIIYGIVYKNNSLVKYEFWFPYDYLSNNQKEKLNKMFVGEWFKCFPSIEFNPKRNKLRFTEKNNFLK